MEDTCPGCGALLAEVDTELVGVTCWKCPKCGLLLAERWLEPGEFINVTAIQNSRGEAASKER